MSTKPSPPLAVVPEEQLNLFTPFVKCTRETFATFRQGTRHDVSHKRFHGTVPALSQQLDKVSSLMNDAHSHAARAREVVLKTDGLLLSLARTRGSALGAAAAELRGAACIVNIGAEPEL